MTTTLSVDQTTVFNLIAALPGGNRYGGPGLEQLDALAAHPQADRWALLSAFAEEAEFNMSVDERLALRAAGC